MKMARKKEIKNNCNKKKNKEHKIMIKTTNTKIKMEINVGQTIFKVIIPTSRTLIIIMILRMIAGIMDKIPDKVLILIAHLI